MSESFQTLRRLLADEVEPRLWGIATTTSASPANIVSSTDFKAVQGDGNALDGGYIYWTGATLLGQQRPVKKSGLTVSTGDVELANPFTAATPSGEEFEWHGRFPVKRTTGSVGVAGYLEMLNDAMRRLWFEDELSVSGVSGQSRYLLDIATYPWLANHPKRRILDVIGTADPVSGVRRPITSTWWIDDDAEAPALILEGGGFTTGDTFYLKVARPCWTRIKIAGVWTDLTPSSLNSGYAGFANDADEAHVTDEDILALAIVESFNHLSLKQPEAESSRWEQRRLYWAGVAARSKFRNLPRRHDGRVRHKVVGIGGGMMAGRRF